MLVGIVHTFASPCRCHATLERALARLGHELFRIDSDDVSMRLNDLARAELVFDQTDTYRGEGLLRPAVRGMLEARGVRCVGSGVRACFLADDKLATKRALARAGVPVPESASPGDGSLAFPRVLKAVHEHMSRGLALVRDAREEEEALARAGASPPRALFVERFVEGRELAVTILGDRVLPIVEWPIATGDVLGTEAKRAGPDPEPATLATGVRTTVERHALSAFDALGLADWARFDVRLDASGTPWFLEANTKPSLEVGSPCLVAAAAACLDEAAFANEILTIARRRLGPR